jgi:hypothetical protein
MRITFTNPIQKNQFSFKHNNSISNFRVLTEGVNAMIDFLAKHHNNLDEFQRIRAFETAEVIRSVVTGNLIIPSEVKDVCDFGAGRGGSTLAILKCFNLQPSQLTALEKNKLKASRIVKSKILPIQSVIVGDGIEYLKSGRKKFDLINAGMFGPDLAGDFLIQFLKASTKSISSKGNILIYSDPDTMKCVREIFRHADLKYYWLEKNDLLKGTAIIPMIQDNIKQILSINPDKIILTEKRLEFQRYFFQYTKNIKYEV